MRGFATVLACALLLGCAGVEMKPGTKSHARRDIPPGPGILTGEQGEFVLFRLEGAPSDEEAAGADEAGKAGTEDEAGPAAKP